MLGLDAFDEFDLPRDTICTVIRTARFYGRTAATVRVDGGDVAAAVVDRGRFDRALADRAVAAGAVIVRGARVQRIAVVAAHGVIGDDSRCRRAATQVRGRVCVLACGAQYRFNRQLGLGIPRAYLQTAQIETPFPPVDAVEIDLDRSLAPRGFAWIVPFRRGETHMARVGLMASDGAGATVQAVHARCSRGATASAPFAARPRLKLLPLAPVEAYLCAIACSRWATPPAWPSRRPAAASTTAC